MERGRPVRGGGGCGGGRGWGAGGSSGRAVHGGEIFWWAEENETAKIEGGWIAGKGRESGGGIWGTCSAAVKVSRRGSGVGDARKGLGRGGGGGGTVGVGGVVQCGRWGETGRVRGSGIRGGRGYGIGEVEGDQESDGGWGGVWGGRTNAEGRGVFGRVEDGWEQGLLVGQEAWGSGGGSCESGELGGGEYRKDGCRIGQWSQLRVSGDVRWRNGEDRERGAKVEGKG
ncbi:hypothetical protein Tco_0544249 [Tanacetum coccineum]